MSNQVTVHQSNQSSLVGYAATAAEVKARVQRIQQVMKAVMKDGVHYGKLTGGKNAKNTLFKPGAEVLCVTFNIAPKFQIEDISTDDCIRYRVTCVGIHQPTGAELAEGLGEASSNEEKYKWREAVCDEEYDDTPEDRRRIKYRRWFDRDAREYQIERIKQVRTEPADLANTILKMAAKRAHVAMAINATAAGDIFNQDLEDLPDELRESLTGEDQPPSRSRGRQTQAPRPRSASANTVSQTGGLNEQQASVVRLHLDRSGVPENEFLRRYGIEKIEDLPFAKLNEALLWLRNPGSYEAERDEDE